MVVSGIILPDFPRDVSLVFQPPRIDAVNAETGNPQRSPHEIVIFFAYFRKGIGPKGRFLVALNNGHVRY